jgi:hypothetical protein
MEFLGAFKIVRCAGLRLFLVVPFAQVRSTWQMTRIGEVWKKHSEKIIAGLVLAGILGAVRWFMSLAWLKTAGMILANWLSDEITISRYWMLIGIGAGLLLGVRARTLPQLLRRNQAHYRQDEVFGVLWEWGDQEYTGDDGFRAFCPKCQAKLLFVERHEELECVCASCDLSLRFPNSDEESYRTAVNTEIERRLRTGEWRQSWKRLRQLRRKRK